MGSGNSIKSKSIITLHSDRGGHYLIMQDATHCTFKWGTLLNGIEVVVMEEFGNALSAHLIRNNVDKNTANQFDISNDDGYIDVFVKSDVLEIRDVQMKIKGICRESLEKVIFAAVRTYSKQCQRAVKWGCVNISSKNSIAAYYCYVNAFKTNGFSTSAEPPESDDQESFVVDFVKEIHTSMNLGPITKQFDMTDKIDHQRPLHF
tara:strand:+ start:316 stop:930 length:615 start_codon:yes stop_codon:yes gene_type:complete